MNRPAAPAGAPGLARLRAFLAVRHFTGLHMLVLMVVFFGVVIAVNVTMAVYASTSWSGLVARNGYVASIDFARAEAAHRRAAELGWTVDVAQSGRRVIVSVTDKAGRPVAMRVRAQAAPAASGENPRPLALDPDGRGAWQSGPDPLTPGLWVVHADLSAPQAELAWRVLLEVGTR